MARKKSLGTAATRRFGRLVEALGALLKPHGEVVLHDLASQTVAKIANAKDHRRSGDQSLLSEVERDWDQDVFGPYEKCGGAGQRVRSVSVVLRDDNSKPVALLCVNLDFEDLDHSLAILEAFIRPGQLEAPPDRLFRSDWREEINKVVGGELRSKRRTAATLTRDERVNLVGMLDSRGLMKVRNAADHVAELLSVSRATVYNDLSRAREGVRS